MVDFEGNCETLITRQELARILPVSYWTLARWASQGEGPPYIKVGPRRVAYRIGDVKDWLKGQRKVGQS